MKVCPLHQLMIVALFFGGLLLPMLMLSRKAPPVPGPVDHGHVHAQEETLVTAWATLHFAHPPLHVHLHQGARDLWHLDPTSETEFETELELGMSGDFAEIIAHVTWPANTPESVVELTLEPDGLQERTRSEWGRTKLDTILAFQW